MAAEGVEVTTIAYRDGVMAGDSLVSDGGLSVGACTKIHRIRGHLVGGVGSLGAVMCFCDWFKKGADEEKRPRVDNDFDTIVVSPSGEVIWYSSDLIPTIFRAPFHAIGSGCAVALGAMHMGASARKAVQVAALVDQGTGLPVKTLKL